MNYQEFSAYEGSQELDEGINSQQRSKVETHKVKVRHAHKVEGVFETGLDVVEQEFEVEVQGTVQQIRNMFNEGKITESQMNELIVRQLKQQKIFAFGSYDEFFNDYFKRDLVAVEDLNRARLIINARKHYEKRKRTRIL